MKIDKDSKYFLISVYAFGVVAASILLLFVVQNLAVVRAVWDKLTDALAPFIYGFAIAYILNYPYRWFMKQFSKKKSKKSGKPIRLTARKVWSILIVYLLFLVVLGTFFYIVVPQIVNAVSGFVKVLPAYAQTVSNDFLQFLTGYLERFNITHKDLTDIINKLAETFTANFSIENVMNGVVNMLTSTTIGLKNFFLGLIISIYFLFDKEMFVRIGKKFLYAFFKQETAEHVLDVLTLTDKTFGGFIIAKVVESTLIGVLCYIGMVILRLDFAVLISVIIGITNIIPFFGPFIGAVPSVLLLFTVNPWQALILIIFIIVLQQLDGNVIGPKLMSDSLGIRPVYVIVAVLVGGGLFGVMGMFVGVPLFAVIYALLSEFVNTRLLKRGVDVKKDE